MDPWLTVFLLGAAAPWSGGSAECPCPKIPTRNLTDAPSTGCRQINSTYRYSCVVGYVRKAGTSNRIRCEQNNGAILWKFPPTPLECIEDPKSPKTQPKSTTEKSSSNSPETAIPQNTTKSTPTPTNTQMKQNMSSSASHDPRTDFAQETTLPSTNLETTSLLKNDTNFLEGSKMKPAPAAAIGIVIFLTICCATAIGIFLYRRRSNTRSLQPAEEQVPMNCAPKEGCTVNFDHY